MTKNMQPARHQRMLKFILIIILAVILSGLSYTVLTLPSQAPGLSVLAMDNLDNSGVSNPVTAVLLNYRGYDTLLEMGVLLLSVIGVWSLTDSLNKKIEWRYVSSDILHVWSRSNTQEHRHTLPEPVLDTLARLLIPLLVLMAGYLLWVGAYAPGGAFQAGSVLGAAGVLLLLSDIHYENRFSRFSLRIALIMGLGMFVTVGLLLILMGKVFLEYPPVFSGSLILLIESAATLSVGFTLAALFLGEQPATQFTNRSIRSTRSSSPPLSKTVYFKIRDQQ